MQKGLSSKEAFGANWELLIPPASEVFWQAENSGERGCGNAIFLLSILILLLSDKEATGTASSVSSLINLLIRLIQHCCHGNKPFASGKSSI